MSMLLASLQSGQGSTKKRNARMLTERGEKHYLKVLQFARIFAIVTISPFSITLSPSFQLIVSSVFLCPEEHDWVEKRKS